MKLIYRLRLIPLFLSIIFTFISFVNLSGVSLPYQDPTAEMLDKQTIQINTAETLVQIGFYAIAVSIIFFISVKIVKGKTAGK